MDSITHFLSTLLSDAAAGGFTQGLAAVAIAYVGGILSSLTPCIYPMIPITVSVVGGLPAGVGAHPGGKAAKRSWARLIGGGAAYVAGMTLIYSFLGVAAGLTGKVFGSFTNTSGWYLGLGLVMTFAALVMIDVLPFDPVVWWETLLRKLRLNGNKSNAHEAAQREMTLLGAFGLGATSGFIAAPCTTPVLTAILAYIAKTQSVGLGLALMISFSLGLGTLLLVIAAFTGALKVLPRSGQWMKTIKLASGLLLLAFAEYLIFRAGALGGP